MSRAGWGGLLVPMGRCIAVPLDPDGGGADDVVACYRLHWIHCCGLHRAWEPPCCCPGVPAWCREDDDEGNKELPLVRALRGRMSPPSTVVKLLVPQVRRRVCKHWGQHGACGTSATRAWLR